MNGAYNGTFFGHAPVVLGRGQKVKYYLISSTKSISKIFSTKLCVSSHKLKNVKHIRPDFHFRHLGHVPSVGLGSTEGGGGGGVKHFLSFRNSTKFGV